MVCLQFKGNLVLDEYKFNIMEDVNTEFGKFNFWRYYEIVASGPVESEI